MPSRPRLTVGSSNERHGEKKGVFIKLSAGCLGFFLLGAFMQILTRLGNYAGLRLEFHAVD